MGDAQGSRPNPKHRSTISTGGHRYTEWGLEPFVWMDSRSSASLTEGALSTLFHEALDCISQIGYYRVVPPGLPDGACSRGDPCSREDQDIPVLLVCFHLLPVFVISAEPAAATTRHLQSRLFFLPFMKP